MRSNCVVAWVTLLALGTACGAQSAVPAHRGARHVESVEASTPRNDGTAAVAQVVPAIRSRLRAIQICWEARLREDPTTSGKVTVAFVLRNDGRVDGVRVTENTTGRPAVAACVVDEISTIDVGLHFDGAPAELSFPFVFAPNL